MRAASVLGATMIVALAFVAPPARGQGAEDEAAPTEAAPTEAAPTEATPPDAAKLYGDGQERYVAKDYEAALPLFERSYAAQPSPNSHLFVARCLRELGRSADAYNVYGEVMVESGSEEKYARTHQAAGAERQALEAKIGRILLVTQGVELKNVTVGGTDISARDYDRAMVVNAGELTVQADVGGQAPFVWSGVVEPGTTTRIEIAPKTDGQKDDGPGFFEHPLAPFAIGSGVVAVAGFLTWGIMGTASSSTHDDLQAQCDGRCPAELQDDVDSGRTQGTVSVIGLVVGLVGLTAAGALTTLILLDDDQDGDVKAGQGAMGLSAGALGADVGGFSLVGAF